MKRRGKKERECVCMCVFDVCIYISIHVYTHMHTHIHTHTVRKISHVLFRIEVVEEDKARQERERKCV